LLGPQVVEVEVEEVEEVEVEEVGPCVVVASLQPCKLQPQPISQLIPLFKVPTI